MTDTVVETFSTTTTVEVVDGTAITVENVAGTATLVETPAVVAIELVEGTPTTTVLEIPAQVAAELELVEGTTIEVETTTGPTGHAPVLYSGTAPPDPLLGTVGDLYLVNSGGTIGDLYQKDGSGWGTPKGNLRGGIASVNGISGTNIIIGANNITTGVLPIAQVPTGTTGSTVAFGNHLHTGVYEPVIATGLTTQYWRGDKTWVVIDKASIGLSNVVNVDTSNASNISSGTLAIGRIPTGTTSVTVALGNHNHDAAYVGLTGSQAITGTKTFSDPVIFDEGGSDFSIRPGTADHAFFAIHARTATPTVRSAYIGYGGAAATALEVRNEITNGNISIQTAGTGIIQLTAPSVAVSAGLRVGTSTTAGYVLTADASGNATWQQTANIITPGTTAQYYRGDLTWQTLNSVTVDLTTNQTVAGTKTFSSEIVGPTAANVLKVGAGARLTDAGVTNGMSIIGVTDPTKGVLVFGNSTGNWKIDVTTTTATIVGATQFNGVVNMLSGLTVTGTVTATTLVGNGASITALAAVNLTGTIDIARIPTGTTGTTVALGNHAHTGVYEPVIAAGTTAQYWRGDKSWQTLNATAVGLGNVANVIQVDLTSGQTITGAKVLNNASNVFTGNGAALTALNASNLATGTVPQARTPANTQRFIFTTGSEARPTGTTYVDWIGPVTPTNATNDDSWTNTSINVVEDPIISMPIGTIQEYGGTGAPTNWMALNGVAISRTTYSALYALMGTTYGVGDGATTFNLPNHQFTAGQAANVVVDVVQANASGTIFTSVPTSSDGTVFTTTASGTLWGIVSASAYATTSVPINLEIYVDGVIQGTMVIATALTTNAHQAVPSYSFNIVSLAAGAHRIALRITSGSFDSGDYWRFTANVTQQTRLFNKIIKVL